MAIANSPTLPGPLSPGQPAQLQLHDIHVPEQVSNFPIAPGWWLLLTLIVIGTFWIYKKQKQRIRLNASKKQALTVLENNPTLSAKECISLLKWAAMQYINRQQLAKLYGQGFQEFLMKQLPEKHQASFTKLSSAAFQGQYQAEQTATADIDRDCHQATKLWLNHALPIKQPLAIDEALPNDKTSTFNTPMPIEKDKELSK
ncbi:DUF4381 domain-containing protein [Colwellia demingiae]|uniref:DUF4381 domain-containing protein n=1 Tax=Colwellia demingiae TaxID=89401 RepID=A0A5C6QG55_9GAMM|nr:DUF4381 domain-containing protein [Colwellia demingiae]TWX67781.1 DUF4381 domain-containing protein [Colwellia demingiae]